MADAYIAEIRMFGCNFAPRSWVQCNGQLMSIAQNTALFSILGTTYGGNGTQTFGLPNLQGSAANGQGQGPGLANYQLGDTGGTSTVTLIASELPAHNHTAIGDNGDGTTGVSTANAWATPAIERDVNWYTNTAAPAAAMNAAALGNTGGNGAHNNMQPYQIQNFCICTQGIFPVRN